MHQSHNNQKSRSLWKCVMGLMAIVFLLGAGATLAQAEKGPDHSDLRSDHANLAIEHGGLDQKLDQVLEDISNLGVGAPLCGAGTEGQRFVVNGPEVCDNTTGLYWQKTPDNVRRDLATANGYCQSLGNGIRLPTIKELLSLVDYGQFAPVLPPSHPFTNVQIGFPSNYWTTTPVTDPSIPGLFWQVPFRNGRIPGQGGGTSVFVWCVR